MFDRLDSKHSRRIVLGLPFVPLIAGFAHQLASAQSTGLVVDGDCTDEPALKMVMDFATGHLERLPYQTMEQLQPGLDWELKESVEMGALSIPPGWQLLNVQANQTSENGVPVWEQPQLPFPYWGATFIVSPDEEAAYIYISGRVDGPPYLDGNGLIELARTTVMGSDERPRTVCTATQFEPGPMLTNVQFVTGDRYGRDLVISRGFGIQSETGGMTLGPGTQFGFEIMAAPRREAAEYMEEVFLKIMWQAIPKGGSGAADSTPTPSPTPGS